MSTLPWHRAVRIASANRFAAGIDRFAALGAGPFIELGEVALETCTYEGRPARFEHRVAFGQWGPIAVELQCVDAVEPATFGELMGRLQVLDARISGRLETLATRIDHAEQRYEQVSATAQRIEQYLLESRK